jgi:hypothetical protein
MGLWPGLHLVRVRVRVRVGVGVHGLVGGPVCVIVRGLGGMCPSSTFTLDHCWRLEDCGWF